jgi:hypothetical protein
MLWTAPISKALAVGAADPRSAIQRFSTGIHSNTTMPGGSRDTAPLT